MAFASKLSLDLGGIKISEYNNIIEILKSYDLPVKIKNINVNAIYEELFYDKKTSFAKIGIVCLEGISKAYFKNDFTKEEIISALDSIIDGEING